MAVSLVLMVAANFLYSLADKTFTLNQAANIAMLLSGRFLVGVAAGNYAVVQSYFSYATRPSQRLSVMSWNAGPAIAAACNVKPFQLGPVRRCAAVHCAPCRSRASGALRRRCTSTA